MRLSTRVLPFLINLESDCTSISSATSAEITWETLSEFTVPKEEYPPFSFCFLDKTSSALSIDSFTVLSDL